MSTLKDIFKRPVAIKTQTKTLNTVKDAKYVELTESKKNDIIDVLPNLDDAHSFAAARLKERDPETYNRIKNWQ